MTTRQEEHGASSLGIKCVEHAQESLGLILVKLGCVFLNLHPHVLAVNVQTKLDRHEGARVQ